MQWTAPVTCIAMCQSAVVSYEARMSYSGYDLPIWSASSYGRNPFNYGSWCPNYGFLFVLILGLLRILRAIGLPRVCDSPRQPGASVIS
jgi:hypothetical protein